MNEPNTYAYRRKLLHSLRKWKLAGLIFVAISQSNVSSLQTIDIVEEAKKGVSALQYPAVNYKSSTIDT